MALSATVRAQEPAPNPVVSYELRVYSPGVDPAVGQPIAVSTIDASTVACNQPRAVLPAITVNPTRLFWADPDHLGNDCSVELTTFFSALPRTQGAYLGTLTAINSESSSEPSQPSNIFFRTAIASPLGPLIRKN
jgi:hypothetical protein